MDFLEKFSYLWWKVSFDVKFILRHIHYVIDNFLLTFLLNNKTLIVTLLIYNLAFRTFESWYDDDIYCLLHTDFKDFSKQKKTFEKLITNKTNCYLKQGCSCNRFFIIYTTTKNVYNWTLYLWFILKLRETPCVKRS